MPFLDNGISSIEVTPGDMLVGSGAQATWRVANCDLAARHFTLKVAQDGTATLRPYSASTIVVVNGAAVTQAGTPVRIGDVIAAGTARFAYINDLEDPRPEPAAAESRPAYLIDEGARCAHALTKRVMSIGRDSGAGIPLRDPAVSRFHADIRREAGAFVLYSMGSAGTHVNDQRVAAPKMLEEGDVVRIGNATFRFTSEPLPKGISIAKPADVEEDTMARRSTASLRTVKGRETTGDVEVSGPRRPRMVAVALGTVALVAAAAWFILGRG